MSKNNIVDANTSPLMFSIKYAPLVHCITNYVTMNDCANALLAIGASPIMGSHILEVEEITRMSDALVLNMGATEYYDSMRLSLEVAKEKKTPIVLDPVGVGASAYRQKQTLEFLERYPITVLRGNASELRALWTEMDKRSSVECPIILPKSEGIYSSRGVDVSEEDKKKSPYYEKIVKELASTYHCIVIMSGEIDIISDGKSLITICGGSALMPKVTGMGCMSTALLGAALGEKNMEREDCNVLMHQCTVLSIGMKRWGYEAEQSLAEGEGLGAFKMRFFDKLSQNLLPLLCSDKLYCK